MFRMVLVKVLMVPSFLSGYESSSSFLFVSFFFHPGELINSSTTGNDCLEKVLSKFIFLAQLVFTS